MQLNPPTVALELVLLLHFKCYRGKASLGLTLIKATQRNCFAWYEVLEAKNSIREKCKNLFPTHLKLQEDRELIFAHYFRTTCVAWQVLLLPKVHSCTPSPWRGGVTCEALDERAGALPTAVHLWPAVTFLSCNAIIFSE